MVIQPLNFLTYKLGRILPASLSSSQETIILTMCEKLFILQGLSVSLIAKFEISLNWYILDTDGCILSVEY